MSDADKFMIMPEAQAELDKIVADHPEAADGMRDFLAVIRQAHQGWIDGKYPDFETAVEVLTGERPERVDSLDDVEDGEEP